MNKQVNKKNKGFVLIIVMLLLTILSLSAFVAIEQSQFSYKANAARVSNMKARQISEDARLTALNKLLLSLKNNESNLATSFINTLSDRYKKEGLSHYLSISQNNSSADVYIKQLPTQLLKNGVSVTQNMAYSGVGVGLGGNGSFATRYEVRAKGISNNKGRDVVFWTASDYRFTP